MKRKPIGRQDVLTAPAKDGYVRRFVNDVDNRVQMFLEGGYKLVEEKVKTGSDTSQMSSTVRRPVGRGIDAVLMEIPKEYYDEDQAVKQKRIDETEASMEDEINGERRNGIYGEGVRIGRSKIQ